MTRKTMMGALSAILLVGCAQFAEMQETRDSGSAYLTGKFDQQICELEQVVKAYPWLDYPTSRIVQEVIPPKTGNGISWILETKHTAPQAKIRHYGKKVEYPSTKEELNAWMKTIDDNIAQMKDKLKVAAEEVRRKEGELIAKKKAEEEEQNKVLLSKFCEEQGVDPNSIASNDIRVEKDYYGDFLTWSNEGRERHKQIIATNALIELKSKIPSIANGMEEELSPVLSAISSNNLLNIDLKLCAELRGSDNKYHARLSRSDKFSVLLDSNKAKRVEDFISGITNFYFNVEGKSFGPMFVACGESEDDTIRLTFDANKFGDILEMKLLQEVDDAARRVFEPKDLRQILNNTREKYSSMDIAHNLMRVKDDLSLVYRSRNIYGEGHDGGYDIEEIVKFASQYAAAKSLIESEEAERKRLAEEYVNMPEADKFPLLSVQPKPQMLMKGVSSGVSLKWVQGWLLANKIEHDEPQIDKSSGRATIVGRFYNMDGRRVRMVKFSFCDDALVELAINLEGQSISPDAMIEKYVREFGVEAKVQRIDGEVAPLNQVDNIVVWARDNTVKITTEDVGAVATCKAFAGLVMISENTAQRLVFAGTEERLRYLVFDKDSKADLVINADGTTLRCTKDGEVLKSFAKDKLSDFSKGIDGNINKIEVWDRKLYDYMTDKAKKQKEEKEKAEEEAKKAKAAAALDF